MEQKEINFDDDEYISKIGFESGYDDANHWIIRRFDLETNKGKRYFGYGDTSKSGTLWTVNYKHKCLVPYGSGGSNVDSLGLYGVEIIEEIRHEEL